MENRSSISVLNENSEKALAALKENNVPIMSTAPNGATMQKIYFTNDNFLHARRALNKAAVPMRDIFVND